MISKRVSLSRDLWSAGQLVAPGGVLFVPLNAPLAAPTTPPPARNGVAPPADTRPALFCDRVLVSNLGAGIVFVRPVIPDSLEAPGWPYPKATVGGQSYGSTGPWVDWVGYAPSLLGAVPILGTGIPVPAGAIAFPIECACIGLVVGGVTAAGVLYAAFGGNKRA